MNFLSHSLFKKTCNFAFISSLAPDTLSTTSPIYLDWQASSMIDPRVLDCMLPYMTFEFGNPHSRTHQYGWNSEKALEKSRSQIAHLIGCDSKEIIFTSGATECNNLAVKGCANFYKSKKNHIITSQIEHKCVLDSCRYLERNGCQVSYLPVGKDGRVNLNELEKAITPKTVLVSIMGVNNEIGIMQPLKEIGKLCHEHGVFFHSDCAQMLGKEPINVNDLNIDLMSMSAHKVYGPKGIGALYVRRQPRVRLEPIINGGGQERGLRSGTMPTHLAVGFGKACEIAEESMEYDHSRIQFLSEKLISTLKKSLTHISVNGDREHSYPGCVNISFAGVEGESLILQSKNVAVSSGSACTSESLEPSYVLRALGVSDDLAHTSLRIGIGRFTTEKEIDYTAKSLIESVNKLRDMSPLWEIIQEGGDLSKMKWK